MTRAIFRILSAGPHASIQDGGRPALMRFGVPASGAMDRNAFAIANAALGNPPGAAGIEVSLPGLALEIVSGTASLAIAGGGFVVTVDDRVCHGWAVVSLRQGQVLRLRPGHWGSWAYVAFAGDLAVQSWLGSAATHALSGLGGGKLAVGQVLTLTAPKTSAERRIPCPVWARPRHHLRCVLGPQDRFFAPATIAAFAGGPYRLTDAYDRMGVRLRGPALHPQAALSIPSEPILRGSVQVSGDGVATVLLADHQTTGGYPKIATVVNDDLDGFAQCRPHDPVMFHLVTPQAAVQIARSQARAKASYFQALSSSQVSTAPSLTS